MLKRRDFIKASGIAALTIAGRPALAAGGGMFITMRTLNGFWAAGTPPWNVGWEDMIRLAARAGYDGVDLPSSPAMLGDGPDKVRALLSEHNLKVGFMTCPAGMSARDEGAFKTGLQRLDEVCQFAAAIGCPRLVTALMSSSDIPAEEWRKVTLDRAHVMAPILERHQVRVGVENLAPLHFRKQFKYQFLWTVPQIVAFAKDAGPSFGLCLDAWHWHHSGGTVQDIVAAGNSQVVMVHIDDARKQSPEAVRDNQRLLPGEGVINLSGFLKALKQIDYEGPISPEPLSCFPAGTSDDEVAKTDLEATIKVMKKAGLRR